MSDVDSALPKERSSDRLKLLGDALVALSYAQSDPKAFRFHFIDCLHLFGCGPVRVQLCPAGGEKAVSEEISDWLVVGGREVRVLVNSTTATFPEGTLAGLLGVLKESSPWTVHVLEQALGERGDPSSAERTHPGRLIRTDLDTPHPFLKPLKDRLREVWGNPDMALDAPSHCPTPFPLGLHVRVRLPGRDVPDTVEAPASATLPKHSPVTSPHPRFGLRHLLGEKNLDLYPLHAQALDTGHLQVARTEAGGLDVAIPAHVGGAPWLVASMRIEANSDTWREILHLYAYTFTTLAALIRSEAADAYLNLIGLVLRSEKFVEDPPGSLDEVNRDLRSLAHVYPFSPIQLRRSAEGGRSRPFPRSQIEAYPCTERPIPAQVKYRPLNEERLLAVATSELAAIDRKHVAKTDALVGGVYKFSHQLIHRLLPLRNELDALEERIHVLSAKVPGDLRTRAQGTVDLCRKTQGFAIVLDVLSTAVLNGGGPRAFAEKDRSHSLEPLLIDEEYLNRFPSRHHAAYSVRACTDLTGFVPFRIEPAIQTPKGRIRPVDEFYEEIFGEALLNAARRGERNEELRAVSLMITSGWERPNASAEPGEETGLWLVTMENPCGPTTAKELNIAADGTWEQWPRDGKSPKGGLYFIGLLLRHTEMGKAWIRVQNRGSGHRFGLRLGLRWCAPLEKIRI